MERIVARGRHLVVLISDGAKVFSVEKRLAAFVRLKGITHVLTAPYSQWQNPVERAQQTVY